jgi:hypothetical protein
LECLALKEGFRFPPNFPTRLILPPEHEASNVLNKASSNRTKENLRMNPAKVLTWSMRPRRRWKRDTLFTAGVTGASIAIGALAGGKKGAAIGAISGGVARLLYRIAAA